MSESKSIMFEWGVILESNQLLTAFMKGVQTVHSGTREDTAVITKRNKDVSLKQNGYTDKSGIPLAAPRKYDIIYKNVLTLTYMHLTGIYGLYLMFTSAKVATIAFQFFMLIVGGYGITGGAHRLWTHRTYKAKLQLEILTMLCNCVSYQQPAIKWVRDHRLHHKYSDTDADPHNANRGFFYSHIGWLMVRKNDLVKERGKTIDNSDVFNNPVLQFQKKYEVILLPMLCFVIPTVIPVWCWDECIINSWHVCMFRYIMNLNGSLLVNSLAHLYGNKPYDKNIMPRQNPIVSFFSGGEGFHNYHHTFPWDYRTAELGHIFLLNPTTSIINMFAWLGWAYDLKTVCPEMIKKKAQTTGDGTHC